MKKVKTSIKAILLSLSGMIAGFIIAIVLYLLLSVMNRYHPMMTLAIYIGGYSGYMAVILRIKKKERELDTDFIETGKKSKFYNEAIVDIVSRTEIMTGFIVSIIMGFFGVYIAEVLNLTYLIWKDNKGASVSEIFRYSLTGVFEQEATVSYIYWSWGIAGAVMIFIIVGSIFKLKNDLSK